MSVHDETVEPAYCAHGFAPAHVGGGGQDGVPPDEVGVPLHVQDACCVQVLPPLLDPGAVIPGVHDAVWPGWHITLQGAHGDGPPTPHPCPAPGPDVSAHPAGVAAAW